MSSAAEVNSSTSSANIVTQFRHGDLICAICSNQIRKIAILGCYHIYDKHCLDERLKNHSTCKKCNEKNIVPLESQNPTVQQLQAVCYKIFAKREDPEALFNLGVCYTLGYGVEQDDAKAVKCYVGAAAKKHAKAEYNLGLSHTNGRGANKDDEKIVFWYTFAAKQGHPKAQFNLGVFYSKGNMGFPQDDKKAFFWFYNAAVRDHTKAQCNLGFFYEVGKGMVKPDPEEAVKWYQKAAAQGDPKAKLKLLNPINK